MDKVSAGTPDARYERLQELAQSLLDIPLAPIDTHPAYLAIRGEWWRELYQLTDMMTIQERDACLLRELRSLSILTARRAAHYDRLLSPANRICRKS